MDLVAIIGTTGGLLIVLIPIAGITARFALKPIVESVARLREMQAGAPSSDLKQLDARLSLLEQQMQTVEQSVRQLGDAREFDRQLQSGRS
jgi:hypothetical protein